MKPIRTLAEQWREFKSFALKGNLVDLAIAVIIGGAFGKVVDSFVKDIVMQAISYVTPESGGYEKWAIGKIQIGSFLGNVLNFLIVAGAVYVVMVKLLDAIQRDREPADPKTPSTRECPYCRLDVPAGATRCGHCTSELTPVDTPSEGG